ncbi:bifunctional nuclease family protein [Candidatus Oleimmundimicrobium sp.]|uniref:bifunctional nuclease family protein n=1 Tax=Candidatus Oleimmundimicrobium sp. TaxID=3060597 RepID=UPI0027198F0C|nr:bifunctional nuclease family protein [Candidatus Oleimmundimicrobium sp.]MDO8886371.1 bifunctional nuclease family protein [Candidatus Oleimmundimicrobium sp.]
MIEMTIHTINLDSLTNQPVIILKDFSAHRFLPIWIGQFEATAILMELKQLKNPRPLTYDLLYSLLAKLEIKVDKVEINDLKEGTFYAKLHLLQEGVELEVDARPSDAIALAVRASSPILVAEKVLQKASVVIDKEKEEEMERFRTFLETISPDDFSE